MFLIISCLKATEIGTERLAEEDRSLQLPENDYW